MPKPVERPTAVLEALGEVKKAGLLLSDQSAPAELSAAEELFGDSMCAGPDNWLPFGDYRLSSTPEGLRLENLDEEAYLRFQETQDRAFLRGLMELQAGNAINWYEVVQREILEAQQPADCD